MASHLKMSFRKSKLFTQFLIFGCLLAIVPTAIFSFFCYVSVTREFAENNRMVQERFLTACQSDIEQKLLYIDQRIFELSILPSTTESLQLSVYKYNWTTFSNVNALKTRINEFKTLVSRDGLEIDISLINELGDWVLYNADFYQKNVSKIQKPLDMAVLSAYGEDNIITQYGSTLLLDDGAVYLVHRISTTASITYGYFVVSIPKRQLFEAICKEHGCENLLVLDQNRREVYSYSEPNDSIPNINTAQFLESYPDDLTEIPETPIHLNSSISGTRWIVTALFSPSTSLSYLSFTPYDKLQLEQAFFTGTLITVAFSILAVAMFAVYAFTNRMYRPLGALLSRVEEENAGSSNDEFQVLSNYIDSINNSNQFLHSMLEEQRGQVKNLFFTNLLSRQLSNQQVEERCRTLSLSIYHKWYALAMFRIENTENSGFRTIDTDLILFAVKNIAGELLNASRLCYSGVKDNAFLLLFHTSSENLEEAAAEVQASIEQLLSMVLSTLFIQLAAGVSVLYARLTDTPDALVQAEKALKYRPNADGNYIGRYEEIDVSIQEHYLFPQQSLDGIVNGLQKQDEKRIRTHLHNYIDSHFTQSVSYHEFEYAMARLMTTVIEYFQTQELKNAHLSQTETLPLPEISELLALGYSREVEPWLMSQLFLPILHNNAQQEKPTLAQQIAEIVRQEYDTPLTLEYCASRVGYHPSHVSRIFRQQMGCSFKEYLYLYRIEEAKRMLVQSDAKIQDISNRLCYNNPQNFIRVFKKVEGMTPGEYRMTYKK